MILHANWAIRRLEYGDSVEHCCEHTMPASQIARQKPRKAQVIAPEVWLAVEKAVCAGMGYSQAARAFGIRSPHAIIMKSRRDKWPVPSRVEERARQLQDSLQRRSEAAEQRRDGNEITTETLAQSWAERGEQHRVLTFNLAHSELKAASKRGLPIQDWSAAEKADRMARRAAGLDSEEGTRISIGMEMINQRLDTIDLPKTLD
jgi:hypothetical protein